MSQAGSACQNLGEWRVTVDGKGGFWDVFCFLERGGFLFLLRLVVHDQQVITLA